MFKLDYVERGVKSEVYTNDIKDLIQMLIGIVNNEEVENEALEWCGEATWGDRYINKEHQFIITCVKDDAKENIFNDIQYLQSVANVISNKTGLRNNYIGYDNDSLTWDFSYGSSYMKNKAGKGLYFAIVDDNGKELKTISDIMVKRFIKDVVNEFNKVMNTQLNSNIYKVVDTISNNVGMGYISKDKGANTIYVFPIHNATVFREDNEFRFTAVIESGKSYYYSNSDAQTFINKVSSVLKDLRGLHRFNVTEKYSLRQSDIEKKLRIASELNQTYTLRIYNDNCWWIEIERFNNGLIRFWVGFEDKRNGACRSSLVSIFRDRGNGLSYSTDGINLKTAVWDKLKKTAEGLCKAGMYKIN